ncbi:MAG: hypothetical protein WA628_16625 [Terriglobales bacterium]
MKATLHVLVLLFLICLCHESLRAVSEKEDCDDPCAKPTVWNEFNVVDLKMTVPGQTGYQAWQARFDKESNDIQIEVESTVGEKEVKGRIILVGGRVLGIQGPIAEAGYEIDALDAPVLYMRLVVRLLGEVFPSGPAEITGRRQIAYENEKTGIKFATPSAEGFIEAPWSLKGEINVVASNDVQYDLALTAVGPVSDKSKGYAAHFEGRLSKIATAKLNDGMPLEGWNLNGVGVQARKSPSGSSFDYGAAPVTSPYKLVADIRKKLAADDYAGEPDPSKNFTGFWKENCGQAFGLQIMPYGKDGKYSITFCGPGGCGKVGEEGKNTFITKDPDYVVISESELKIKNALDEWDTYYRCTTDIHPKLEYKE